MYADSVTPSMENAIKETERRREIQMAYNKEHGIIPKTIIKAVSDPLAITTVVDEVKKLDEESVDKIKKMSKSEKEKLVKKLTEEMQKAAKQLEFEYAAKLRDEIKKLKGN